MAFLPSVVVVVVQTVEREGVEVFLQSLTSVILHGVHVVGRHHGGTVLLLLLV